MTVENFIVDYVSASSKVEIHLDKNDGEVFTGYASNIPVGMYRWCILNVRQVGDKLVVLTKFNRGKDTDTVESDGLKVLDLQVAGWLDKSIKYVAEIKGVQSSKLDNTPRTFRWLSSKLHNTYNVKLLNVMDGYIKLTVGK